MKKEKEIKLTRSDRKKLSLNGKRKDFERRKQKRKEIKVK